LEGKTMIRHSIHRLVDRMAVRILEALQSDARQAWSVLARQTGLSAPAVAERVRRLEEAGVILGYHAEIAPEALGYGLAVFMRLTTPASRYEQVIAKARRTPEILECHHVSGGDSFVLKLVARDVKDLERIIAEFSPFGQTATTIVLSSPVVKRGIGLRA
jgi:Lrp/AsnC family transcriptional regulator, leucine-responsive regulatory protein